MIGESVDTLSEVFTGLFLMFSILPILFILSLIVAVIIQIKDQKKWRTFEVDIESHGRKKMSKKGSDDGR